MKDSIEDIVWQWYSISDGGEILDPDIFFRFVSTWIAFNAHYQFNATKKSQKKLGDYKALCRFLQEPEVQVAHERLRDIDEEYLQAIRDLESTPIRDTQPNSRRSPERIIDLSSIHEVMTAVYRVRCNLFHGGKSRYDPRDRTLVEAAYNVTKRLLGYLLHNGKSN